MSVLVAPRWREGGFRVCVCVCGGEDGAVDEGVGDGVGTVVSSCEDDSRDMDVVDVDSDVDDVEGMVEEIVGKLVCPLRLVLAARIVVCSGS